MAGQRAHGKHASRIGWRLSQPLLPPLTGIMLIVALRFGLVDLALVAAAALFLFLERRRRVVVAARRALIPSASMREPKRLDYKMVGEVRPCRVAQCSISKGPDSLKCSRIASVL